MDDGTHIDDLLRYDPVLLNIIGYLDFTAKTSLSLASKDWCAATTEYIGRDSRLVINEKEPVVATRPYKSVLIVGRPHYKMLPDTIEHLTLHKSTLINGALIAHLKKLVTLELVDCEMFGEFTIDTVKNISINLSPKYNVYTPSTLVTKECTQNKMFLGIKLNRIQFPNLEVCCIDLNCDIFYLKMLRDSLALFLDRHKKIKSLSLSYPCTVGCIAECLVGQTELKALYLNLHHGFLSAKTITQINESQLESVILRNTFCTSLHDLKLERLHTFVFVASRDSHMDSLTRWLPVSLNMKRFVMMNYDYSNLPIELLSRRFKNLEELALGAAMYNYTCRFEGSFSFENLTVLTLGVRSVELLIQQISAPKLQMLRVRNSNIDKMAQHITDQYPMLEQLICFQCDCSDETEKKMQTALPNLKIQKMNGLLLGDVLVKFFDSVLKSMSVS